ncbi:MAG: type II toxin-antitoxin system PemK/MazF family toxin [Candidatus Sericytochromatia bacterium]
MKKTAAAEIYHVLVSRSFRTGALPGEAVRSVALQQIAWALQAEQPIPLFVFWGGAKNPHLPGIEAELCEAATLEQLSRLHSEVTRLYAPGLRLILFPGDARVAAVNHIPVAHTQRYVASLEALTQAYADLFEVVPVSRLYTRYAADFAEALQAARQTLAHDIENHPGFAKLVANARKNIFCADLVHEADKLARSRTAACDYIVYRLAEEKARIFRDYPHCLRASLVKFSQFLVFYAQHLDLAQTQPRLDCLLHFYTGGKGNVTQPWQALGEHSGDKVVFLSQERLAALPPASPARPVQQGEIYWAVVPREDGLDAGIAHPHVVLQDDLLNHSRLTTVVVCALSTHPQRAQEPGNVRLEVGEAGLEKASVIVISQLASVDKRQLGDYIGRLSPERLEQIWAGLRFQQRLFEARSTQRPAALETGSGPHGSQQA